MTASIVTAHTFTIYGRLARASRLRHRMALLVWEPQTALVYGPRGWDEPFVSFVGYPFGAVASVL